MADGACAKGLVVSGWGMVALSTLGYIAAVLHPRGGEPHELAAGAAAGIALVVYWRLLVKPRLTHGNENLLLGPFLVIAFGSLAVALAFPRSVAVWVSFLSSGLSNASLGSLWQREGRPGRW